MSEDQYPEYQHWSDTSGQQGAYEQEHDDFINADGSGYDVVTDAQGESLDVSYSPDGSGSVWGVDNQGHEISATTDPEGHYEGYDVNTGEEVHGFVGDHSAGGHHDISHGQ